MGRASSRAPDQTPTDDVNLDARPFLSPLPRLALAGGAAELLHPYRFVPPGSDELAASGSEGRGVANRRELAEALRSDNRRYGHPRAEELAAALARGARVVVTGQQPGVFGGPLYTWSKAVAASRWAEQLAAEGDAVAVFWIASDDHDWNEIASAWRPGLDEPIRLERADPADELRPVGPLPLGPGIESAVERLGSGASGEQAARWRARLAEIFRPESSFTEAFARLLVELLGARCPLLLDAANPTIKRLAAPTVGALLDRHADVATALAAREREITARGLELQVRPRRGVLPLFVHDEEGRRRRLAIEDGRLLAHGAEKIAGAAVHRLLADQPERFSPSVLARPAVQDALLGTSLFLVGPGELAYAAQAAALYPVLDVAAPALALRPQVLLLDQRRQRQAEELERLGIRLEDLLGAEDELHAAVAAALGSNPLGSVCGEIRDASRRLKEAVVALDSQLAAPAEKTGAQIERALGALEKRVAAAVTRRDQTVGRRVLELREQLLPQGRLQERVTCCAHLPFRYRHTTEALAAALALDPARIQVLEPELSPAVAAQEAKPV